MANPHVRNDDGDLVPRVKPRGGWSADAARREILGQAQTGALSMRWEERAAQSRDMIRDFRTPAESLIQEDRDNR